MVKNVLEREKYIKKLKILKRESKQFIVKAKKPFKKTKKSTQSHFYKIIFVDVEKEAMFLTLLILRGNVQDACTD